MSTGPNRTLLAITAALVLMATTTMTATPAAADAAGDLIHDPQGSSESNIYARTIELAHAGDHNGNLVMTFERDNPDGGPVELLIKNSSDDGKTWQTLSTVGDPRPGTPASRMWQPELFEFPRRLGSHPAGTLMLISNLVPADGARTEFFSWYSDDHGKTWQPGDVIQTGGTFGRGIWEPHLILDARGRLQMYFADERSAPEHSQMIVHVTSTDGGETWGDVVRDVASDLSGDRPGMPTVVRKGAHGAFVLSYEICGRAHCNVHLKESADGSHWGPANDLGPQVVTPDGRYPGHSPYVTWVPTADGSGQLVLSAQRVFSTAGDQEAPEDYRVLFLNDGEIDGPWHWAPSPWTANSASSGCNANYSPHLMPTGTPGDVRLTAPTSVGTSGPCGEATGVASVGALPFSSAFAVRGEAGWIGYGGAWEVDGDVYRQTATADAPKAVTGSTGWTDYTVASDIRLDGTIADAGLLARTSDPSIGPDSHHGYYAFLDPVNDRLVIALQDYSYQQLAAVPVPDGLKLDSWYRLSFSVTTSRSGTDLGATLVPAAGGTPVEVEANDPYTAFPQGMVGLRTHDGAASFRQVNVESTD